MEKKSEVSGVVKQEVLDRITLELNSYKRKTEVLASLIEHMDMQRKGMENTVNLLEECQMRNSVVITGLLTDKKITKCIQQVDEFLSNMEVVIIDCFKLVVGEDKPVVITLESIQQKIRLFQGMANFKKLFTKENKQTVFINDYQPAGKCEQSIREKSIYRANEVDQSSKEEMELTRRGLKIKGSVYQRKLTAPDATKVLSYDKSEFANICDMVLDKGNIYSRLTMHTCI